MTGRPKLSARIARVMAGKIMLDRRAVDLAEAADEQQVLAVDDAARSTEEAYGLTTS